MRESEREKAFLLRHNWCLPRLFCHKRTLTRHTLWETLLYIVYNMIRQKCLNMTLGPLKRTQEIVSYNMTQVPNNIYGWL